MALNNSVQLNERIEKFTNQSNCLLDDQTEALDAQNVALVSSQAHSSEPVYTQAIAMVKLLLLVACQYLLCTAVIVCCSDPTAVVFVSDFAIGCS